jgi:hypothetical protein
MYCDCTIAFHFFGSEERSVPFQACEFDGCPHKLMLKFSKALLLPG